MGMAIDKAIHFANCLKNNCTIDFNDMESFCDTALDTMSKYQEIEAIMSADLEHIHPLDRDKYIVASIKEVLKENKDV
jgi:hypothetical protein